MMTFAEGGDSKEIKIRRLNGWLHRAVWAIIFLLAVGTIAGFLYWRRSGRVEKEQQNARHTAVELILRAFKVSDSLDVERHNQVMEKLDRILDMHRRPSAPEESTPRLDAAILKKQLMEQKSEEKR